MKAVYILRGVSGCGKSTLANQLAGDWGAICSADYYFTRDGKYEFNHSKLKEAHLYCRELFNQAIRNGTDTIVVDNTNTLWAHADYYYEEAMKAGYSVISLVVENRHGGKNVHNVPAETIEKQESQLRNSLKLV